MAGIYVPGHGNVGTGRNIRETVQGYDPLQYHIDDRMSDNGDGTWGDGAGGKYNRVVVGGGGDQAEAYGWQKYNDALTTTKNTMDWNGIEGFNPYGANNYEVDNHPDWINQAGGRIKTSETGAHNIIWNYDAASDQWVPRANGQSSMDTNANNRMRNMAFASMLAGGVAATAAGAGAAGAGLADAGAVAGAAEPALGAGGLFNGATGITAGTGSVGTGIGAGGVGVGGSSWFDTIKQGYDYYNQGKKIYNGVNTISDMFSGGQQQGGGGRSGMTQQGGGSWLDSLFNMGGSIYSANKNDNYADELRQERQRSLAERQPFLDRVGQLSGDAGADQFRNGGTWQAAERVASERFNRNAAKGGTLANDTDRQRLLQDHFMGQLDKERTAARGDLNAFDEKASRDAFMKALEMDRMKNSPLFAGAAYGSGGGGGSLAGLGGMVGGAAGQVGNWYDQIFGSGASTSTWGDTISNPNYGYSIPSDFTGDYGDYFDSSFWGIE